MRIELSPDDLRPLVQQVVAEVLADRPRSAERLAWTEAEAAELLGLARHQLRDRRLEGRVRPAKVGKSYLYSRQDLEQLLQEARES